mgnify:CR=1 FL=1
MGETQRFACSISSHQRRIKEKALVYHKFHMYSLGKSASLCWVCFGVFKKCLQKVSSKSVFKNNLSAVHFCCVFGSFGTFLAIWWVWWQKSKKSLSQSLKKTLVTIFITAFIAAYDYTAQEGCKKFIKNGHF